MSKGRARPPLWGLKAAPEALTLAMIVAVHGLWLALLIAAGLGLPWWLTVPALVLLTVQFQSLQHEALHGHPTRSALLNEVLVSLPLGLFYPFRRYRTLHLRHHNDENLTDPFDDPESWYFAAEDFASQHSVVQALWRFNATLVGRLVVGPFLAVAGLIRRDGEAILRGDRGIARDWALHGLGLAGVLILLLLTGFSPLLYVFGVALPAMSILLIRSFAEHRASALKEHRTAIIPDRGPLALLFLNNNLHAVHHAHPSVAWYRLPRLFAERRADFEASNGGYGYRSYVEVFAKHWRRPLDTVPHPLWNRANRTAPLGPTSSASSTAVQEEKPAADDQDRT